MKYNNKNIELKVMENVSQLIFDKGIKGWNMDELSRKSGLAKNTLYRIISSKEDIVNKVLISHIKRNQSKLVEIMETETDYITALQKIIKKFPELMNSIYTESVLEIFNEYPNIELSVRAHRDELTQSIIEFIQKGAAQGKLRQDIDAEFLFELLQSVVLGYIRRGYKGEKITAKLSLAFDYLLNGVI